MSSGSSIEWTEATWNPVVGCTRASRGCDHCYAVKQTHRLAAMGQAKYAGLTVLNGRGDRHFNGAVRTVPEALTIPLHWRKPRMIFVNSMSDLFHKDVPFEFIDLVFAVMALCPQHTFQILTKRPERMAEYLTERRADGYFARDKWQMRADEIDVGAMAARNDVLDNVWLGTSCEDQETFNARAHVVALVPAAVRFLSLEPLLGPINWSSHTVSIPWAGGESRGGRDYSPLMDFISWILVGGESGGGARPCNIEWIRSIIAQCREAGVACFVKQLGSVPYDTRGPGLRLNTLEEVIATTRLHLNDRKGGDPAEWPANLRVREFPGSPRSVTGGYVGANA